MRIFRTTQLFNEAVDSKEISLRALSKILGNLSWAVQAVPYAQSHFRSLQSVFNSLYHYQRCQMETMVSLDSNSISHLLWWLDHVVNCAVRSIASIDLLVLTPR